MRTTMFAAAAAAAILAVTADATAATPPRSETLSFMDASSTSEVFGVIATGAFTDAGTILINGPGKHPGTMRLARGTIKTKAQFTQTPHLDANPTTCFVTERSAGTLKLLGGTGAIRRNHRLRNVHTVRQRNRPQGRRQMLALERNLRRLTANDHRTPPRIPPMRSTSTPMASEHAMNMQTPNDRQGATTGVKQIIGSHWKLFALLIVDLALFIIAELTYKNAKHPGTVSNIAWYAFLIGTASLVILAILAIFPRSRRPAR